MHAGPSEMKGLSSLQAGGKGDGRESPPGSLSAATSPDSQNDAPASGYFFSSFLTASALPGALGAQKSGS